MVLTNPNRGLSCTLSACSSGFQFLNHDSQDFRMSMIFFGHDISGSTVTRSNKKAPIKFN